MINLLKIKLVQLLCMFNFSLPNFKQWEIKKKEQEKSKAQYIVEHTILNQKCRSGDY